MPNSKKKERRKQLERERIKALEPPKDRRYLWAIAVLAVVAGAFLLRVIPQMDIVLGGDAVMYKEVDPWYHMRMVDSMLAHFPGLGTHDPYAMYPSGAAVAFYPMLSVVVVAASYIVGLGSPTQHTAEIVGAFVPPVAGALICLIVFFIGRELADKRVGLLAAILVAILPTQFLFRSLLGFTDHHVLEVLFSTATVLFIMIALRKRQHRYACLAGLALGCYMLNWLGAPFLMFILWVWFVVQFFVDWARGRDTAFLGRLALIMFGISSLTFMPYYNQSSDTNAVMVAMAAGLSTPVFLYACRRWLVTWPKGLIALLVAISMVLVAAGMLAPDVVKGAKTVALATLWSPGTTIAEAKSPGMGGLMLSYGFCLVFAVGGLVLLAVKRDNLLILVWSAFMTLVAFAQIRWGYYWTINVALLSAYFMFWAVNYLKETLRITAVAAAFFAVVLLPGFDSMTSLASVGNHITDDWYKSLVWVRDNTPEPLPDGVYITDGNDCEADYSVLSWWDYGHWITRVAHRVPLGSPAYQTADHMGAFLAGQTPEEGEQAIEGLGVKYVILDNLTVGPKFHAVVSYANRWRKYRGLEPYSDSLQTIQASSNAVRLWENRMPGYELVYETASVKVFERVGD